MSVPSLKPRTFFIAATVVSLAGCAVQQAPAFVADTIAATPQLSTFSDLITKAGLTNTLRASGPFTVFAPTNDAFSKVPAKRMDALAANPAELRAVLAYHVISAKVMAADVKNGNVKTIDGANLALSKAGGFVTVEDAMVEKADIAASNGVIHVIDRVLVPAAR